MKLLNLKLVIVSGLLSTKLHRKLVERKIFIDSVLKNNPWTCTMKDFNAEKTVGSFYEKESFLSKLRMSYCPEPDNDIIHKVKIVLDLSNYATKNS